MEIMQFLYSKLKNIQQVGILRIKFTHVHSTRSVHLLHPQNRESFKWFPNVLVVLYIRVSSTHIMGSFCMGGGEKRSFPSKRVETFFVAFKRTMANYHRFQVYSYIAKAGMLDKDNQILLLFAPVHPY
ncbi:hypothetical protein KIL84_013211 [Mauremys mutica]|uniref:Uncharacterized protein n=1 Tax=Mauremys mutica TaxID=74926 RepID=A0A9D3WVH8_9SAUR|nr:hypothetical protein KIL84_013211 [Mauremys mutica]